MDKDKTGNYLYTIYDVVAEKSGPLYEAVNDGVAVRNFRHVMQQTPADQRREYNLVRLGAYEPKVMSFELTSPEVVVNGADVIAPEVPA